MRAGARWERLNETLHAMALKNFLACPPELCTILLQALLNRCIVTKLFSAKAGSIARACVLFLWCPGMPTLC
jgi:hypothetical protein